MNYQAVLSDPTVLWFLAGLGLMLLEMAVPGLVLIFFGVGAWITSLCNYLFSPSVNIQLLIFFVSSIAILALLRRQLRSRFFNEIKEQNDFLNDEFIGRLAVAETEIGPGKEGKVTFKGTLWTARSVDEIKPGQTVEIIDTESICLLVKPK